MIEILHATLPEATKEDAIAETLNDVIKRSLVDVNSLGKMELKGEGKHLPIGKTEIKWYMKHLYPISVLKSADIPTIVEKVFELLQNIRVIRTESKMSFIVTGIPNLNRGKITQISVKARRSTSDSVKPTDEESIDKSDNSVTVDTIGTKLETELKKCNSVELMPGLAKRSRVKDEVQL